MDRRTLIIAAILGIAIGSTSPAAAVCTPAEVIRQRFVDDGGTAAIVSDPRGVEVITQAIKDKDAAEVSDTYLVVAMRGIVLVYPLRDGKVCAAGVRAETTRRLECAGGQREP